MPPNRERIKDSKRNWRRMLELEAPTAFLMPISWVRSETETSMMFMMPMPPTTREMPATIERTLETTVRREPAGWVILSP